jgi:hypothetical protein
MAAKVYFGLFILKFGSYTEEDFVENPAPLSL